jgi:hypothetical protein
MTYYRRGARRSERVQENASTSGASVLSPASQELRNLAKNPGVEIHVTDTERFEIHEHGVFSLDHRVFHSYSDRFFDPLFDGLLAQSKGQALRMPGEFMGLKRFLDLNPEYGMKVAGLSPSWWKAMGGVQESVVAGSQNK